MLNRIFSNGTVSPWYTGSGESHRRWLFLIMLLDEYSNPHKSLCISVLVQNFATVPRPERSFSQQQQRGTGALFAHGDNTTILNSFNFS
jgi:hypothetical protein